MEYMGAIESGFELYDKIENEIRLFLKISDSCVDVSYEGTVLTVKADCRTKDIEAEVMITREEIFQKALYEDLPPKEAICMLLKEKICLSAHDIK